MSLLVSRAGWIPLVSGWSNASILSNAYSTSSASSSDPQLEAQQNTRNQPTQQNGPNISGTVRSGLNTAVSRVRTTLAKNTSSGYDVVTEDTKTASEYRPPTPPTGVPLSKLLSNVFPLSYTESYQQWLARNDLATAEHEVLSTLPFYPETDGVRSAQSLQIPIDGAHNYINEFEISQNDEPVKEHLVVLHGYGAGLGFFYKNFDAMSRLKGWKVHALDLLGYGRSSRPKFRVNTKDPVEGVLQAEKFFLDSLEQWRINRGIEKFTLVAHSLGAYIGTSYACKYRDRVKKMLLVSPAGVPRSMYSIDPKLLNTRASPIPSTGHLPIPGWFKYLWECRVSPFSLVRNTGPLGPRFVSGWTSRRFANLDHREASALHKYVYGIFNARGSGEYALNYLLAPGAHGRWPLAERAHDLPCPSVWLYGTKDWMDINGGHEAVRRIKANGGEASVVSVPNAGHHIYLDNPPAFNAYVTKFMKGVDGS